MKVPAFYSKKYPGKYHICTKCTEGNNIEEENKVDGTGGGELCERCKELIAKSEC